MSSSCPVWLQATTSQLGKNTQCVTIRQGRSHFKSETIPWPDFFGFSSYWDWTLRTNHTTGTHQKLSSLAPVPGAEHLGTQALHSYVVVLSHLKSQWQDLLRLSPHQTTVFLCAGPKAHTGTYPHTSSASTWHAYTHTLLLARPIHLVITDVAW